MYSRMPCSLASSHLSPASYPQGLVRARILVITVQTGRGLARDSRIGPLSPVRRRVRSAQRLGDPACAAGADVARQGARREPADRLDLALLAGGARLPGVDAVDQHMVAAEDA